MDALYVSFKNDATAQSDKQNKAAGVRARKQSLEMEKLCKEFRKLSITQSKGE